MQYVIEYCKVAMRAYENGFVTKKIQHLIDEHVLEEATKRMASKEDKDDAFSRAAERLHFKMCLIEDKYEREAMYLEKLGITEKPYKVLYRDKQVVPGQQYVYVTKVYEDDSASYEKFYGYPKMGGEKKTLDDFIADFKKIYGGTMVLDRDWKGPFQEPSRVTYYYDRMYTVEEKGEK